MYFYEQVSKSEGYDAAGTGCGWAKFWNVVSYCYVALRLPLRLTGAVYKSCVWPAILYESEVWCVRNNDMTIMSAQKSMAR